MKKMFLSDSSTSVRGGERSGERPTLTCGNFFNPTSPSFAGGSVSPIIPDLIGAGIGLATGGVYDPALFGAAAGAISGGISNKGGLAGAIKGGIGGYGVGAGLNSFSDMLSSTTTPAPVETGVPLSPLGAPGGAATAALPGVTPGSPEWDLLTEEQRNAILASTGSAQAPTAVGGTSDVANQVGSPGTVDPTSGVTTFPLQTPPPVVGTPLDPATGLSVNAPSPPQNRGDQPIDPATGLPITPALAGPAVDPSSLTISAPTPALPAAPIAAPPSLSGFRGGDEFGSMLGNLGSPIPADETMIDASGNLVQAGTLGAPTGSLPGQISAPTAGGATSGFPDAPSPAAQPAAKTPLFTIPGTNTTSADISSFIKNNGKLLLGAGSLAGAALKKPQVSQLGNLQNIANSESAASAAALAEANALIPSVSTGVLPAGADAMVSQAQNDAINAIKSKYASMGMSGSSTETQEINQAIQSAASQRFTIANQLTQTGLTAAGLATSDNSSAAAIYDAIMQAQLKADSGLQTALANFGMAAAVGSITGK
jgi:hypothetical protein